MKNRFLGLLVACWLMAMGGIAQAQFNPASPPTSVKAYYEADKLTVVADGTQVTSWSDASSSGGHTLSGSAAGITYRTAANGINNHAVVQFAGSTAGLRTAAFGTSVAQNDTVFIICKTTTGGYLIDNSNLSGNRQVIAAGYSGKQAGYYAGTALINSAAASDAAAHMIETFFGGVSSFSKVDGTQVASGTGGANPMDTLSIGNNLGQAPWAGAVACVIVYDSTATAQDLIDIRAYLNAKYAVGASVISTATPSPVTTSATTTMTFTGFNTHYTAMGAGFPTIGLAITGGGTYTAGTVTVVDALHVTVPITTNGTTGSFVATLTNTTDGALAAPSVQVIAPIIQQIVFEGNSLTAGYGVGEGSYPSGNDYPSQCIAILGTTLWTGYNVGVDSTATINGVGSSLTVRAAANVDAKFNATTYSGAQIEVVWEITNDIYSNSAGAAGYGTTAATNMKTYCLARRAAGWKIVVLTALPRNNSVPANFEANRIQANAYIRAHWKEFADAIADVAGDSRFGQPGQYTNTTWYNADLCHMTIAGYGAIAQYVAPSVFQAASTSTSPTGGTKRILH